MYEYIKLLHPSFKYINYEIREDIEHKYGRVEVGTWGVEEVLVDGPEGGTLLEVHVPQTLKHTCVNIVHKAMNSQP